MNASMQARLSVAMPAGITESLLAPLITRAGAHRRFPQLRFRDVYSELILQALNLDTRQRPVGRESMLSSCLRARWIQAEAVDFLRDHPGALGVSLGAGLDTLYLRLCDDLWNIDAHWYDIDLPAVVDLKRNLLSETNRYRMVAGDVCDPQTIAHLQWAPGQPALFVLEGVLMYLPRAQVEALLKRIFAAASWRGATVAVLFDHCSPCMSRQRQHVSDQTSPSKREHQPPLWSLEHPEELQWLHPQLRVHSTYDLMRERGVLRSMLSRLRGYVTGGLFYGCAQLRCW